jgi:3-methyladenine DNA glycosylase Mpg
VLFVGIHLLFFLTPRKNAPENPNVFFNSPGRLSRWVHFGWVIPINVGVSAYGSTFATFLRALSVTMKVAPKAAS